MALCAGRNLATLIGYRYQTGVQYVFEVGGRVAIEQETCKWGEKVVPSDHPCLPWGPKVKGAHLLPCTGDPDSSVRPRETLRVARLALDRLDGEQVGFPLVPEAPLRRLHSSEVKRAERLREEGARLTRSLSCAGHWRCVVRRPYEEGPYAVRGYVSDQEQAEAHLVEVLGLIEEVLVTSLEYLDAQPYSGSWGYSVDEFFDRVKGAWDDALLGVLGDDAVEELEAWMRVPFSVPSHSPTPARRGRRQTALGLIFPPTEALPALRKWRRA